MNFIFFSLLAALSFGIGTLISKFASRHTLKNWQQLWVYFLVLESPISLLVSPFLGPITWPRWGELVIFFNSFFFVVGLLFFFRGLMTVDASIVTPFFQLQSVGIVLLAFLFLGERFPSVTYFWLIIVILGTALVTLDEKMSFKTIFQPSTTLLVIANLLFAASSLATGLALKTQSISNVLFWTPIVSLLLVGLFIWLIRPPLKVKFVQISPLIASGVFQFIGVASIMVAYQQNLTISGVLGLLSAPIVFVITVTTSKFFPQLLEHHSAKVYAIRGLGLAIILFGAIKLTLGG